MDRRFYILFCLALGENLLLAKSFLSCSSKSGGGLILSILGGHSHRLKEHY
jgi:hypothetical protein